jgi:RHS repeat-associated protein
MKTLIFGLALYCITIASAQTQSLDANEGATTVATNPVSQTLVGYQTGEQGANQNVWQKIVQDTDTQGNVTYQTNNAYTELATGLNHLVNGQWVASKEEIDISADGNSALATNGQHQAYFPGDIYSGQIELVTPDGKQLHSRPAGLSYFDGTNSVLIAELTNSTGEILPSGNQVTYTNAFTGFKADIRYTYTKAGFEQDIILREQPPSPASFGLNPNTTRLQVLTEFFDPPQPTVTAMTVPTDAGDLENDNLDFGVMQMIPGKAFLLGTTTPSVVVNKQWLLLGGRQMLVEEVPFVSIAGELENLPLPQTTSIQPNPPLNVVSTRRLLPTQRMATIPNRHPMQLAKATPASTGLVLDYTTINSSLTNYTFRGDTTYYIYGTVVLGGTNTFEGGTVLKYDDAGTTTMELIPFGGYNLWTFKTGPYRPAIFTSMEDNSVGETISGSTGSPYNTGATYLNLYTDNYYPNPIQYARFSYAGTAIEQDGGTHCSPVLNCQFVNCSVAILDEESTIFSEPVQQLYNVLMSNCGQGVQNTWDFPVIVDGENMTVDQMNTLLYAGASISASFTNCIFTAYDYLISSGTVTLDDCVTNASNSGFYKMVGAGDYYLAASSTNRNAGTTNINLTLLTYLRQKTTYPPLFLTNQTLSANTNFNPQALRDTNSSPSLGYHYDPIDYIADLYTVTNATMTLTNGVAIASYNEAGVQLQRGSTLVSIGTPLYPNWFVRYSSVQEQSVSLKGTNSGGIDVTPISSSVMPNAQYQFTKFACPAGGGIHLYDYNTSSLSNLTVQECEFWGGTNVLGGTNSAVMTLINNLFARSVISASGTGGLSFSNNLVWGALLAQLNPSGTNIWRAYNNDFDSSTITNSTLTNGYNAYLNYSGYLSPTNTTDIFSTNTLAYQTSWLGTFYQPASSLLIDMGSTNASALGLYHYTTQTNQVPETNSIVDIGYHYVATDTNGIPLDSNGDGIPDYLEDANGDGIVDNGETNWGLAILTQPVSQTVAQGTSVTFSVTAQGVAPLVYQWYFNGTILSGATNSSLTIPNAQVANEGTNWVVVTNFTGSLTSAVATLTLTCDGPPSGLVGWWQAESNALDSAGADNGIVTNGISYTAGKIGTAFKFDGTNGFIQVLDAPDLDPTNLTIEAWVRFSSLNSKTNGGAPPGEQFIINKPNVQTGTFHSAYLLYKWRNGSVDNFEFEVDSTNGTPFYVTSSVSIQTNVWYHVAGVRGSNYVQLFVNGQPTSRTTVSFAQNYGNEPLTFGSSGEASIWEGKFEGSLDEVSLYNRALSTNEIVAIYAAGTNGLGKCLLPPTILTQPSSQTVIVGETVTLMVVATGSQPLSYQWYFNATNLLSAATNAILLLPNVQSTNYGNYSVTVSNGEGMVASTSASLVVDTCSGNLDVALVMDRSGSMSNTLSDGKIKLTAIRIAATNFVQNLNYSDDQAAIFSFNDTVTTNQTLTNSLSVVLNGIGSITNASGFTYMANALQSAQAELTGTRHHNYALPIMVFLSDGDPNDIANNFVATSNLVLNTATQIKATGTRIITIAVGTDADTNFMRLMATSPNDFYYATNSAQLTNAYNLIATSICRGSSALTVSITSPTNNQVLLARTNFTISATATNPTTGVYISWVEFFANGTNAINSLGFAVTPTNGLYQLNWTPPVGGTNVLTALAMDSRTSNVLSSPVTVYVRNLPAVTITSPTNGQVFSLISPMSSTNISVTATAVPDRSTITNVVFYQGTNVLGTKTTSPYSITWSNVAGGTYTVFAMATDSNGVSGTSFPIQFTVNPTNLPPQVYAGPNQTNNLSTNAIQLAGFASDDGLPLGSTLSTTWTNLNGGTNVTFANSNLPISSVFFWATGTYTLRLSASDGQYTNYSTNTITILNPNLPPVVIAGTNQTLILPALANTNPISTIDISELTNLNLHAGGVDYFVPSNSVIVSVATNPAFDLIASNGNEIPFSSINTLKISEAYIATVKDSIGHFRIGEIFCGNGTNSLGIDGEVMRIEPEGTNTGTLGVNGNAWVILTNNTETSEYPLQGLWVDRTGVWGGDLIISTLIGDIWRVNSSGKATLVTQLPNIDGNYDDGGETFEGITTIPNNTQQYGPWAGRLLVGGDYPGSFFAVDTNGFAVQYSLPFGAEDIRVIPDGENMYGANDGYGHLFGVPASNFQGMAGDILIAAEGINEPPSLYRLHWSGTTFDIFQIGQMPSNETDWAEINFSPAGILTVPIVDSVALNGTVQDDGLLSSPTSNLWFQVSGPASVTFDNPALTNTTARFTQPGVYYLQLSAYDGQFTSYSSNQVQITVIRNQAPMVNAGTNQLISTTNTTLYGNVSDDGWPSNQLTMSWSLASGPVGGAVSFGWTNQISSSTNVLLTNSVSFSIAGTYVLQLSASDGQAVSLSEVTNTVESPSLTLTAAYGWPTRTNMPATFTANLVNQSNLPMTNSTVVFIVTPGNGASPWTTKVMTDTNGNAFLTYSYPYPEQDIIQATNTQSGVVSPVVIKDWGEDISCGSSLSESLSQCWSLEWPTNDAHYSDYYLYNATAGEPFTLNYTILTYVDNLALILRDRSNNIVAINLNGSLAYTPLMSGDYLIEIADTEPASDSYNNSAHIYINTPSYQLALSCGTNANTITTPQVQVLFNGTNVLSGGTVTFPTTLPSSPTNLWLVITNPGTADLTINNVQLAGDFTNISGLTSFDIPAGAATNLQLGFNASSNETDLGELLIQPASINPYVVYLVGNAYPTGAPPVIQLISPINGSTYYAPATISFVAQASSSATNISYVDFQEITTNGIIDLGRPTGVSNLYTTNAANLPAGDYSFTAVAVDAVGRSTAVSPVTVHVLASNNNHPPIAVDDQFTVPANSTNNIRNPLANDSDPDNNPLTITSLSSLGITSNSITTYNGGTATIINNGQAISYTPPHGVQGGDGFTYYISDGKGGTAKAGIYINIYASAQPTVSITSPPDGYTTNAGATLPIVAYVTPSQNIAKVDFYQGHILIGELTNGYNGYYTNSWTAIDNTCGCGFTAQATDIFGQINTSGEIHINVTPPSGVSNSIATLAYYTNSSGTVPFTNYVTIRDGIFKIYGQAYQPQGSNVVWQLGVYTVDGSTLLRNLTLANTNTVGSSSTTNFLATCDLSTLVNGVYQLRLSVIGDYIETDTNIQFILESNLKLGQFSFSQQDLVIPVNGIPLTVTRTYNSINPDKGDFGYGWTYSLDNMDVNLGETRENVPDVIEGSDDLPGGDFSMLSSGGRNVTLTLPNGQRTTFYYYLVSTGYGTYQPQWQAEPGVTATLGVQGSPVVYQNLVSGQLTWDEADNYSGDVPYNDFDFEGFVLTNQDGTLYFIDRPELGYHSDSSGGDWETETYGAPYLAKIVERSGDVITINPNSIIHIYTNGATNQIVFQRNADGLITSISDPNGLTSGGMTNGPAAVQYQYDSQDNLINVLNLVNRSSGGTYVTNSFSYTNVNFPHYITGIINADGTQVAKNLYDTSGKLVEVDDANGNRTLFGYNTTNDTQTVIDRLGNTNTYVYDTRGNVLTQTNALNQVTTMAYDVNNNKTNEVTYLNGLPYAANNFVYDTTNQLLSSTDPLGHTNGFTYDGYGHLLTSADALGHATTNTYDGNTGNLLSTSDALGNKTIDNYNNAGLLASSIDPLGNTNVNYYDSSDNLTGGALFNLSGTILSSNNFTYDADGNRLTSIVWRHVGTSWVGATNTYIYDAQNRVTQTIDPDGGTNTVNYDSTGKQSATIDPLGRTNSYTYDALGRLIQTTYPDLTTETNGYDFNGNRIASADRLGRLTTYAYDALNRMTNTIHADNTTNTTVYDGVGRVAQTIDARGTITGFNYDAAGRRLAVTNAVGTTAQNISSYSYDANGNQLTFTDANNHTTTNVFDALNRQVQVQYPDGTKTSTGYDADGQSVAQTNQDSLVTLFGYDGVGRLTMVTNALSKVTGYQYDEAGNEIAQIDALGRTNSFVFDSMGRRIAHMMPTNALAERFNYDLAGNIILDTNFNGVIITNQYDVLNRLTNRASINGYQVSYTYTATGQRLSMTDPSGMTAYSYDNRDRLLLKAVAWTNGPTVLLNYRYDSNGNLTNLWSSTANGVTNVYQYDPLNRLTSVVANGSTAASYNFDGAGNLQSLHYGNGVTNLYQYDSLNRLTNLVWKYNTTTNANFYYQLGLTGNRTNLSESVNGTSRTCSWQYDNLYRLTNENISAIGNLGYGYDPVGNRTNRTSSVSGLASQTPTYNTNDWLTSDGYDNNGNTTNSASNSYQYDVMNRVTNVNNTIIITYDGDGNRVSKSVSGATTYYLLDDRNPSGYSQVLEEYQITGLNRVYNYGLDLISQRQVSSGTVSYYGYDGHGSTRFLLNTSGGITDTYTYDAYGNLINSSGSTANNYLYAGQQFDSDLGLYYNRARYWNTGTGRFLSSDSVDGNNEDPLSLHKYLYAQADPVNHVDPSGHDIGDLMLSMGIGAMLDALPNITTVQGALSGGSTCGSDVTKALQNCLDSIQNWFNRYDDDAKNTLCLRLLGLDRTGNGGVTGKDGFDKAWDIPELAYPTLAPMKNETYIPPEGLDFGSGNCWPSVAIDGKAYFSRMVNYALFGKMMSISFAYMKGSDKEHLYSMDAMHGDILGWKASSYFETPWDPEVTGADAFADYGYTGSKTGLASAAIPGARVNRGDIYNGPFKDWVWEPYRVRQN